MLPVSDMMEAQMFYDDMLIEVSRLTREAVRVAKERAARDQGLDPVYDETCEVEAATLAERAIES